MKRLNLVLAGLAVGQGALAAVAWWPKDDLAGTSTMLVDMEPGDVKKITVWDGKKEDAAPVVLSRQDDGWHIDSAGGYPAADDKVDKVLDALVGVKVSDPLASSATTYDALEVADDSFAKKVELSGDSGSVTVLVGSGSGRAATVRRVDDDAVYRLSGVSQWTIGAQPRNYYDTEYLAVEPSDLQSFSIEGAGDPIQLQRVGETWVATTLPQGLELDQDAVGDLLDKATTVRLSSLPDDVSVPPRAEVTVHWTIATGDEQATEAGGYVIGPEEDGKRAVRADGSDYTVLASAYSLKAAVEATWDSLGKPAE